MRGNDGNQIFQLFTFAEKQEEYAMQNMEW